MIALLAHHFVATSTVGGNLMVLSRVISDVGIPTIGVMLWRVAYKQGQTDTKVAELLQWKNSYTQPGPPRRRN